MEKVRRNGGREDQIEKVSAGRGFGQEHFPRRQIPHPHPFHLPSLFPILSQLNPFMAVDFI